LAAFVLDLDGVARHYIADGFLHRVDGGGALVIDEGVVYAGRRAVYWISDGYLHSYAGDPPLYIAPE
jgi:hypothetical protein